MLNTTNIEEFKYYLINLNLISQIKDLQNSTCWLTNLTFLKSEHFKKSINCIYFVKYIFISYMIQKLNSVDKILKPYKLYQLSLINVIALYYK